MTKKNHKKFWRRKATFFRKSSNFFQEKFNFFAKSAVTTNSVSQTVASHGIQSQTRVFSCWNDRPKCGINLLYFLSALYFAIVLMGDNHLEPSIRIILATVIVG